MTENTQGSLPAERDSPDVEAFLERLDQAIERSNMKRTTSFAEAMGLRSSTVSEWWTQSRIPMGDVLLRLPEVLGVNGHWLLTGEGDPEKGPSESDWKLDVIREVIEAKEPEDVSLDDLLRIVRGRGKGKKHA